MRVVILAGGCGARLGNLTEAFPEPMTQLGEKPIIWHIMKMYSHCGCKDFVLSLGYKQEVIEYANRSWKEITHTIDNETEHAHEANLLQLDSTKARTTLNWQSSWGNEETLERTIDWYKEFYQDGAVTSGEDLEAHVRDAKRAGIEWEADED